MQSTSVPQSPIIVEDDDDLEITYVGPTSSAMSEFRNTNIASDIPVSDGSVTMDKTLQSFGGTDDSKQRPKPTSTSTSSIKLAEFESTKPTKVNQWLTVVRHQSKVTSPTGSPKLSFKDSDSVQHFGSQVRQSNPNAAPRPTVLRTHSRNSSSQNNYSPNDIGNAAPAIKTASSVVSSVTPTGTEDVEIITPLDKNVTPRMSNSTVSVDSCKIQPLRPSSLRDGSSIKPIALPIPDAVPKITIPSGSGTLSKPPQQSAQNLATSVSSTYTSPETKSVKPMPNLIPVTAVRGNCPIPAVQSHSPKPVRFNSPIVIHKNRTTHPVHQQLGLASIGQNLTYAGDNPVKQHNSSSAPVQASNTRVAASLATNTIQTKPEAKHTEMELKNQELINTLGLIKSFGEIEIEKRIGVSNSNTGVNFEVPAGCGLADLIPLGGQASSTSTTFAELVKSVERPASRTSSSTSAQVMTFYSSSSNDVETNGNTSPFLPSTNSTSLSSSTTTVMQQDTKNKPADYSASSFILNLAQIPLPQTPYQRIKEMEIHPIIMPQTSSSSSSQPVSQTQKKGSNSSTTISTGSGSTRNTGRTRSRPPPKPQKMTPVVPRSTGSSTVAQQQQTTSIFPNPSPTSANTEVLPSLSLPSFSSSFLNNTRPYGGAGNPFSGFPTSTADSLKYSAYASTIDQNLLNWTPTPEHNSPNDQQLLSSKFAQIQIQQNSSLQTTSGWIQQQQHTTAAIVANSPVSMNAPSSAPVPPAIIDGLDTSLSSAVQVLAPPVRKRRSYPRKKKSDDGTGESITPTEITLEGTLKGSSGISDPKPRRTYARKPKLDADGNPVPSRRRPNPATPRNIAPAPAAVDTTGDNTGSTPLQPPKKPPRRRRPAQTLSRTGSVSSTNETEEGETLYLTPEVQITTMKQSISPGSISQRMTNLSKATFHGTSTSTVVQPNQNYTVSVRPQPITLRNLGNNSPTFTGQNVSAVREFVIPPVSRFPLLKTQPKRQRRPKPAVPVEMGKSEPGLDLAKEKSKRRLPRTKTPATKGVPYVPPTYRPSILQKRRELEKLKAAAQISGDSLLAKALISPSSTSYQSVTSQSQKYKGGDEAVLPVSNQNLTTKTKLLQNITQTLAENQHKSETLPTVGSPLPSPSAVLRNPGNLNGSMLVTKVENVLTASPNPSMLVTKVENVLPASGNRGLVVTKVEDVLSPSATNGIMTTVPNEVACDPASTVELPKCDVPSALHHQHLFSGGKVEPMFQPSLNASQSLKSYPAHKRVANLVQAENRNQSGRKPRTKPVSIKRSNTNAPFFPDFPNFTIQKLLTPDAARRTLEEWKQSCSKSTSETPSSVRTLESESEIGPPALERIESTSASASVPELDSPSVEVTPPVLENEDSTSQASSRSEELNTAASERRLSTTESQSDSAEINPRASGRRISRRTVKYAAPVPASHKRFVAAVAASINTGDTAPNRGPTTQNPAYKVVENPKFRWTFTEDELEYIFQEGNFVMKRSDMTRTTDLRIWKVIESKGLTVTLKAYDPYTKKNSNRYFHVSNYIEKSGEEIREYGAEKIVLDKNLREIFKNFLPVYVEKICHSPEISVAKLYRDDRILPHIPFILKNESSLKEAYYNFVRTLICNAMDPKFLDKVINSELEPHQISAEAFQLRTGWSEILSRTKSICQEFMASPRWSSGAVLAPFLKFPKLTYSAKNIDKERNCNGCGDTLVPLHSPTKLATFDGIPYDPARLMPNCDGNPEDENKPDPAFQFCHTCTAFLKSFHSLHHLPYHVLITIHFRLEMMQKEFPPETKFDALSVKQALDADIDWFKFMFLDFLVLLSQIKGNMEQMARCSYITTDEVRVTNEL